MSKATSAKQIAANRRNAQKSTGPKTAEGLAASKMNALKHGILSREVLVRGRYVQEDEKELEELHGRFREALQPEGPVEEMLVDQIVTCHWRLRRALTAEAGEIALSVDGGQRRRGQGMDPAVQWLAWNAGGDPAYAMEQSTTGLGILIDYLEELRARVEAEGGLTAEALEQLRGRFGGKPNSLLLMLESLRGRDGDGSGGLLRTDQKQGVLGFLERKLECLKRARQRRDEEDYYLEEAGRAAAVLPSAQVLEKISRYETKLERQLHRAMAQLERLQRMRRGEDVPAPVSVNLNDRS